MKVACLNEGTLVKSFLERCRTFSWDLQRDPIVQRTSHGAELLLHVSPQRGTKKWELSENRGP